MTWLADSSTRTAAADTEVVGDVVWGSCPDVGRGLYSGDELLPLTGRRVDCPSAVLDDVLQYHRSGGRIPGD